MRLEAGKVYRRQHDSAFTAPLAEKKRHGEIIFTDPSTMWDYAIDGRRWDLSAMEFIEQRAAVNLGDAYGLKEI